MILSIIYIFLNFISEKIGTLIYYDYLKKTGLVSLFLMAYQPL